MRTVGSIGLGAATGSGSRREPGGGRRGDRGLISLEWLLVVAAIAGVAASSVLIVQRVVDEHTEVPDDPLVRLLEADIAAAFIADGANAAALSLPYDDPGFKRRCEVALKSDFDDVVVDAVWAPPETVPPPIPPPDPPDPPALSSRAKCTVRPVPGLGPA